MQPIRTEAGIDVSAKTLTVLRLRESKESEETFSNDGEGHRALVKWLGKGTRVCMEATGVYHLQLALTLRAAGVEVMVVNPRVAKDFGRALGKRSKTDPVDASSLLEYVRRMEFTPWEPPSAGALELREVSRRLTELVQTAVEEKNRLHSKSVAGLSAVVVKDVKAHIAQIGKRVEQLEKAGMGVIAEDVDLRKQFEILTGIRGVGRRSAMLILGELSVLD